MPELTLVVRSGMVLLVLLLIVTVFAYHVWLDGFIERRKGPRKDA